MTLSDSVKTCFSKYATFSGRASRSEYWYFCLFNVIVSIVLYALAMATGLGFLTSLYSLAVLLPGLAVFTRRMHDIGKSGWNYFWVLLPIVGAILLLIWLCRESDAENQYGAPEA